MTWMARIRESWRECRQGRRCQGRATSPALCGVSLIREIREIRGRFFADHAYGLLLGSARRPSAFRLRGREGRPAEHAEGRRTGSVRVAPRPAQTPFALGRLPGRAFFRRRGIADHRDALGLTACGDSGMPPPPTPSASGGGWNSGGGGPGVAAWRPYPRLLSETLSGF